MAAGGQELDGPTVCGGDLQVVEAFAADELWEIVGNLELAERRLDGDLPDARGSVYSMRMARVNITVPDDLFKQAKAAGMNVSRISAAALAEELDRRVKIEALDRYLRELDAELGPVPAHEAEAARVWADDAFGTTSQAGS
jgi:post-segregation antitoxin (ccd killing protein)